MSKSKKPLGMATQKKSAKSFGITSAAKQENNKDSSREGKVKSFDDGTPVNMERNEEKLKHDRVEGTPFTIIETTKGKPFLVMGKYRFTEEGQFNRVELINHIKNKSWTLLTQFVVALMSEKTKIEDEVRATLDEKRKMDELTKQSS